MFAKKAMRSSISGFTLVELIVVITILAILATVGFLSLSGYSDDARAATVKANVRTVYSAILTETTTSGNSPRYYVNHDAAAALSGASAYLEDSQVVLSGGQSDVAGTNYSAGNPRWDRLRMNGDKFKLAFAGPEGLGMAGFAPDASAAYSAAELSVGAVDVFKSLANGRKRNVPFFQVAAVLPWSKAAVVTGNYPSDASGTPGLVRSPESETGALRDWTVWPAFPTYPGCDTPDITLANGQRWAACNVGASTAYVGGAGQPLTASAISTGTGKTYMGAYYQWGRNLDVTTEGTVAGPLDAAAAASETRFITNGASPYNWIATQNGNLWGGGSTSLGSGAFAGQAAGDQAAMRGPCAAGYHVPTQAEWYSALSTINPALTNAVSWQNDTSVAATLKLPLAGYRHHSSAAYYHGQGTNGYYWASSPTGTNGYYVALSATQVHPADSNGRAYGFSVRCLKN